MGRKQYFGIIFLLILIVSAIFYWYEYRPSKIRTTCFNESNTTLSNDTSSSLAAGLLGRELKYEYCLKKNGLEVKQQLIHLNIDNLLNN